MGTWGPGNFDSDQSLDYVGDLCGKLEAEIDGYLNSDGLDVGKILDDIMPRVAVLTALVDQCLQTAPSHAKIGHWREVILFLYDGQIHEVASKEFAQYKRSVICKTLSRLEFFSPDDEDAEG